MIETINEKDLETKIDFLLGEGSKFTGQMKKFTNPSNGEQVYIKHGKGT